MNMTMYVDKLLSIFIIKIEINIIFWKTVSDKYLQHEYI